MEAKPAKPTILIIAFTDHQRDPRVYRQIMALSEKYRLVTVGLASAKVDGVEFHHCDLQTNNQLERLLHGVLLLLGLFALHFKLKRNLTKTANALRQWRFDLVIANDVETLPLTFLVAPHGRVLLDAHEYAPEEQAHNLRWTLFYKRRQRYLCEKYIQKLKAMSTVCDSIAVKYRDNFGRMPTVINNAPFSSDLQVRPTTNKIRLIHHGIAIPNRNLEAHIEMMRFLDRDRFEFNFMLVPTNTAYMQKLKKIAAPQGNIFFLDPVPMQEIANAINKFDIGVFLFKPKNVNESFCLPNKFFEYIQGRLAIAIGPSIEMSAIVRQYDLGVIANDYQPESLAEVINALSAKRIDYFKAQSHRAASELSAERNATKLHDLVSFALQSD